MKAEVLNAGAHEEVVPRGVVEGSRVVGLGVGVREDVGAADVAGKVLEDLVHRLAHVHGPVALALGLTHNDLALFEVDVRPAQVAELGVAESRVDRRDQDGREVRWGEPHKARFFLVAQVANDLVVDPGFADELDGVSADDLSLERFPVHRGEDVKLLPDGGGGGLSKPFVGELLYLAGRRVLEDEGANLGKQRRLQDGLVAFGGTRGALGGEVGFVVLGKFANGYRDDGVRQVVDRLEPLEARAFDRVLALRKNATCQRAS
ncbi:MAG TPA: hypothetical protein VF950_08710 [Planctomycetota bacterium]